MVHLNEFTAPLGRASESDERCRDKCAHRGVLVLTMPSYINSVMMCGADAAAVTEMCIYVLRFSIWKEHLHINICSRELWNRRFRSSGTFARSNGRGGRRPDARRGKMPDRLIIWPLERCQSGESGGSGFCVFFCWCTLRVGVRTSYAFEESAPRLNVWCVHCVDFLLFLIQFKHDVCTSLTSRRQSVAFLLTSRSDLMLFNYTKTMYIV